MGDDATLRALERDAAGGDPAGRGRYLAALRRTGAADAFWRSVVDLLAQAREDPRIALDLPAEQVADDLEDMVSRGARPCAVRFGAAAPGSIDRDRVGDTHRPFLAAVLAPGGVDLIAGLAARADVEALTRATERGVLPDDVERLAGAALRLSATRSALEAWLHDSARVAAGAERRRAWVRARPAMWVGWRGPRGALAVVEEAIRWGLDEHRAGRSPRLELTLARDGACTVVVAGDGLSVDCDETGRPGLERELSCGYPLPGRVDGRLFNLGLGPLAALSASLYVEVRRGGRWLVQRFERGAPVTDLTDVGGADETEVRLTLRPDPELFSPATLDGAALEARLHDVAHLFPGLSTGFTDEQTGRRAERCHPDGLIEWLRRLTDDEPLAAPLSARGRHLGVEVDVALTWRLARSRAGPRARPWPPRLERGQAGVAVRAFANGEPIQGGAPVDGLERAIAAALAVGGRRHLRGLVALVSVALRGARFEGSTRSHLVNPEAGDAVAAVLGPALAAWVAREPDAAARLARRASSRAGDA